MTLGWSSRRSSEISRSSRSRFCSQLCPVGALTRLIATDLPVPKSSASMTCPKAPLPIQRDSRYLELTAQSTTRAIPQQLTRAEAECSKPSATAQFKSVCTIRPSSKTQAHCSAARGGPPCTHAVSHAGRSHTLIQQQQLQRQGVITATDGTQSEEKGGLTRQIQFV